MDLLVVASLSSRAVAFLATAGGFVSLVSGLFAWLALVINAGRSGFYEELARYVNLGLAIGFAFGLLGGLIAAAFDLH
jgi:hypothetical protein